MLWLEPGDIVLFPVCFRFDESEADEGAHLVDVAPHRAREFVELADFGIGTVFEKARIGLKAP